MGSTSDKLEYLNETKTKIRQKINRIGGDLDTEDTFRSYADALDGIYESMPKVEGEGESITLNGTLKGGLDLTLKGNTSQYSTTGKQLFDINEELYSGSIDKINNGFKLTKNNTYRTLSILLPKPIPSGSYIITYKIISSTLSSLDKLAINLRDESSGVATIYANSQGSNSFTTPREADRIYFYILSDEADNVSITIDELMLESGSTASDFEPYTGNQPSPSPSYPQPINVVSGDNTIKIEGKNLLDIPSSYSQTGGRQIFIKIPAGTEFTLKMDSISLGGETGALVQYRDKDNNSISSNLYDSTHLSFTRTLNKDVASISIYSQDNYAHSQGITTTFNNIILTTSSDTTYQPYQSQTYPINLGELELCKIGDYQDYFTKNSGKNLANISVLNNVSGIVVSNDTIKMPLATSGNGGTSTTIKLSQLCPNLKNGDTAYLQFVRSLGTAYNNFIYIGETRWNNGESLQITDTLLDTNIVLYGNRYVSGETTQLTISNFMISTLSGAIYEPYGTGQWCKYNAIGEVVLDGSEENWSTQQIGTTGKYYYRIPSAPFGQQTTSGKLLYSNYFLPTNTWNEQVVGIWLDSNLIVKTQGSLNNTETLEQFKTWLSTHNTQVDYVLSTPYLSLIEDTTLIEQLNKIENAMSYLGQTNVSQTNDDKPFIVSASALKDNS